jgi:pilus assembly protein FimV
MSKTAAATDACHRLPSGRFRVAVAALVFLPGAVLAADAGSVLQRSEQIDVGRLGRVSEDERSVLRIEWRAGMAGVEETRSVQDMLDKLRRLETGISDVSHLVRNIPAQAPAVAAPAPVAAPPAVTATAPVAAPITAPITAPIAAAVAVEAKAPDTGDYDIRLIVANMAALALVALWWFRRRKPAALPGAALPPPPPQVPAPQASQRVSAPPVAEPAVATPVNVPETPPPAPVELPPALPETVASVVDVAPDMVAETTPPAPVASPEPEADAVPRPSEPEPAAPFVGDNTMIFDFSLEEADPETVARENEKLQESRPASPPEPPPAPVEKKADVEPTLQLAEIMLSMGLEEGAAQALIEYTEANPRHAIYHWLKLLGIYRSRGLQKEFTATAEKLRMNFNIQAAEWGKPPAGGAQTLENFTRIAEHVQKIWTQTEECATYLRHLLEDNRDGERAGFPQSVAEEILLLIEVLKELASQSQPAA